MNLENMLCERSQTQNTVLFYLYEVLEEAKQKADQRLPEVRGGYRIDFKEVLENFWG